MLIIVWSHLATGCWPQAKTEEVQRRLLANAQQADEAQKLQEQVHVTVEELYQARQEAESRKQKAEGRS